MHKMKFIFPQHTFTNIEQMAECILYNSLVAVFAQVYGSDITELAKLPDLVIPFQIDKQKIQLNY